MKKKLLDGREHEKEKLFKIQLKLLSKLKTSPLNKRKIKEFIRDKQLNNVSNISITPYLHALLRLLSHVNKDLKKITAKDLKAYFAKMQSTKSERGTPYSEISINNHVRGIKFFYKWFNGGKDFPKCVEWIKENGARKIKLPDDMMTQGEVEQMIRSTHNTRDQAVISVLYDSAARAGEFCGVRIKDVEFDKLGALMRVDGKTGIRKIRLIESVPYLHAWLQVHPSRNDRNSFVWYNLKAQKWQGIDRQTLSRIIIRSVKRAKIKKRIHPHLFRHSRLTELAPKVTEQVLKAFAGWSPDSRMAAVYIHMSGKNLDIALAKAHGLEVDEKTEENKLAPIICPRCKVKNPSIAMYCSTCSMVLDQTEALKLDSEKKAIDESVAKALTNPEELFERMHAMEKKIRTLTK